jgi:hypothetical protein
MSYIGNVPTNVAFLTDTFNGTGSTTAFTLSAAPANTNSILVAVSGVLQDPSTYSISGTALNFSAAPPAGTGNISVRFLGIPASGIVNTAYRTQTEFTATAGQTTFSVPSYTVGFIDVYRNGALLGSADFTATNGTTVVLAAGASAGDLVETISFSVSSVLNAIPATAGAVNSTYLLDGSVTQAKLGTGVVGNGPAFYAYRATSVQSVSTTTFTKIQFNAESFDTANCFDSTTNYRFTPNVAGYYQINATVNANYSTLKRLLFQLYKNGSAYNSLVDLDKGTAEASSFNSASGSTLVYMNGTTDFLEVYVYLNGTTSGSTLGVYFGPEFTNFSGYLARAA